MLLLLARIVTAGFVLSFIRIDDRSVDQLDHALARIGRTLVFSHRASIRPPDAGETDPLRQNALADR